MDETQNEPAGISIVTVAVQQATNFTAGRDKIKTSAKRSDVVLDI
jgi:hypothetical protein